MAALDGHTELANLALILILAAALAAMWWPLSASVLAAAAAVLGFNVAFVPPRGRLNVDLHQHAWLLVTLLAVSSIVAVLMARLRQQAASERLHALRARQLQQLGDALRDADDPWTCAPHLQAQLEALTGQAASLWIGPDTADARTLGALSADERAGLGLAWSLGQAMGPGTGRHEEQPAWYLPMRGRNARHGAALLRLGDLPPDAHTVRQHAQALCDQMGLAIERNLAARAAADARADADAHKLRHTLLAAVAHDYRTPLATIMGAASSLHDQDARLSPQQRQRLCATILDEAEQLARLTANALQLARLDTPGLDLQLDWESAEELVGTVMRRVRQRDPDRRIRARVAADLPLLRCDAVLLVQLLENLVDNALKYGGDTPVELVVRARPGQLLLAVRDRGPGVPLPWREKIFDVFQRGDAAPDAPPSRGAGVGLAVCRAIARAHGGELRLRMRGHGGASFECLLPVESVPDAHPPGGEARQGAAPGADPHRDP